MKIAVVGTGYVGLVAGTCFARQRRHLRGQGSRPACAAREGPIYEPGLEELVRQPDQKRLTATTALDRAVQQSQILFIAVGTPPANGSADLQHVMAVARDIGRAMNGYKVIVNKSTVPVGTAAKVREVLRRETTTPSAW